MANLNFKYGLLNRLPENLSEGTIYVTTDERAMYIDLWAGETDNRGNQVTEQKEVGGEIKDVPIGTLKRVRLGDFITYPTLTDLFKDSRNWDEHCLVYITQGNILAKYEKNSPDKTFPQYNPETGEPKVEDGKPVMGNSGWVRINNSDELVQNLAGLTATVGALSESFTVYSTTTNQTLADLNAAIVKEQSDRAAAITKEQSDRAADITKEQNDRAAAITKEQSDRAADIASVNAEIASVSTKLQTETTNREKAILSLQQELDSKMEAANAMSFKGVLNECYTEGEGESLKYILKTKETNIYAGDTYKVGSDFYYYVEEEKQSIDKNASPIYIRVQAGEVEGQMTYEDIRVFTGDLVIALSDQEFTEEEGETEPVITWTNYKHHWTHISTGYEDDYNAKLVQIPGGGIGFGLEGGAGEDRGSVRFSSDNLTIKQTPQVVGGITVNDINITLQWSTF